MSRIMSFLGKMLNASILRPMGYELVRASSSVSWQSALSRLSVRSVPIKTVIDIGASDGRWSKTLQSFYPDAFYFLVEAQETHKSKLQAYKEHQDNVDYLLAAAGDYTGEIYFDARNPSGGLASHELIEHERVVKVPVTTVDIEVSERNLKAPYLLKLDTHGFEVPIFRGAEETLKNTSLIVVETYNFTVAERSLRFYEICVFLESKGFRPIDLASPAFRPRDKAFWQVDLFFVRCSREEFQSNAYK